MVHVPNIWKFGALALVVVVQVFGEYTIIEYLDPSANIRSLLFPGEHDHVKQVLLRGFLAVEIGNPYLKTTSILIGVEGHGSGRSSQSHLSSLFAQRQLEPTLTQANLELWKGLGED